MSQTALFRERLREELARRALARDQENRDQSVGAVRARCEESLVEFVKEGWHVLEPVRKFVHGWWIDAICQHLEAVTSGDITRLLINVPPGSMKSLLASVYWPAWEWGPKGMAHIRYLSTSFAESAALRDNRKMRTLVMSDWYRLHWPEFGELTRVGEMSFENQRMGVRDCSSFESLTSKRADRLIIDDPHAVKKAESDLQRQNTIEMFLGGALNRLNDQRTSAIIVIMQRLHQMDISGVILENKMPYVHLMLPMEYEPERHCSTEIGFDDPRTKPNEWLSEERFPYKEFMQQKKDMSVLKWAGQYQQRPSARGTGIIPYNGWENWDEDLARTYGRHENQFPDFEYIIGSADTAYTEKKENDPSAMVVLGIWRDHFMRPKLMLMHAWQARLKINDLVVKMIETGRKYKVSKMLIESAATGISAEQEIRRLMGDERWSIQLIPTGSQDKVARAHSVSVLWGEDLEDGTRRDGLIYVPCQTQEDGAVWPRVWAEMVMSQMADFPKAAHDDLTDCMTQGVRYLRDMGLLRRTSEVLTEIEAEMMAPPVAPTPLYPT